MDGQTGNAGESRFGPSGGNLRFERGTEACAGQGENEGAELYGASARETG